MKLTSLNPRWVGRDGRSGLGITFDCPVHGRPCRLAALFANPIDGGASLPPSGPPADTYRWQRSGTTFEDLRLTPSVHVLSHWHGHITDGEVT